MVTPGFKSQIQNYLALKASAEFTEERVNKEVKNLIEIPMEQIQSNPKFCQFKNLISAHPKLAKAYFYVSEQNLWESEKTVEPGKIIPVLIRMKKLPESV